PPGRAAHGPGHDVRAAARARGAVGVAVVLTAVAPAVDDGGDDLHAAAFDNGPAGRAIGDEDFGAAALDGRSDSLAGEALGDDAGHDVHAAAADHPAAADALV